MSATRKEGRRFCGVTLEVCAGEILGIAGVDGNGQSHLAEAIMHLREVKSGHVLLGGADVTHLSVVRHHAAGLAYIPADRRHVGSVTGMSVADNAILGLHRKHIRGVFQGYARGPRIGESTCRALWRAQFGHRFRSG